MAIDATRNLPSFSEMYQAFKNRASLGSALQAGVEGYTSGKEQIAKENLQAATAKEALAHADYYKSQAAGGTEKRIPLAALPEGAKVALGQYADANGTVTESQAKIYLANTAQGAASEKAANELALRQQALEQQIKHQQEMAAVQQQLADLKASLGQSGQALSAAQTVANTTKGAAPSLAQKIVGKIGEAINTPSIVPDEYTKAKQNAAALETLSGTAGITPAPQPVYPLSGKAKGTKNSPAPVASQADYDALPMGAWFVDSTGKPAQKRGR